MFDTIKESFGITNKYIILATPLILFSLLSTVYFAFSISGKKLALIFAIVLLFLMFAAFLAGWLYMVSVCVKNKETEEPNGLMKHFVGGVGEYFAPVIGFIFVSFLVGTIVMIISGYAGYKLIGNPNVDTYLLSSAVTSVDSMKTFLASLTVEQLVKINLWNMLLFFAMSLIYFLLLFYPAALFFKTKNPIKAFLYAQRDLFSRHFFANVGIYLFILVSYFLLSIFTALGGVNIILHFVFTLASFYYMAYVAVLIFNYYYKNYVRIGSNIDTTV